MLSWGVLKPSYEKMMKEKISNTLEIISNERFSSAI